MYICYSTWGQRILKRIKCKKSNVTRLIVRKKIQSDRSSLLLKFLYFFCRYIHSPSQLGLCDILHLRERERERGERGRERNKKFKWGWTKSLLGVGFSLLTSCTEWSCPSPLGQCYNWRIVFARNIYPLIFLEITPFLSLSLPFSIAKHPHALAYTQKYKDQYLNTWG